MGAGGLEQEALDGGEGSLPPRSSSSRPSLRGWHWNAASVAAAQSFEVDRSYVFSFFFLFLVSFSFLFMCMCALVFFFSWCIFLLISLIFEVHSPLNIPACLARGRESRERVVALSVLDPRQVPRGGRRQGPPPAPRLCRPGSSRRHPRNNVQPTGDPSQGLHLPKPWKASVSFQKGRQVPGTKPCFKIQILLLFRYGRTNRWTNNCQ